MDWNLIYIKDLMKLRVVNNVRWVHPNGTYLRYKLLINIIIINSIQLNFINEKQHIWVVGFSLPLKP